MAKLPYPNPDDEEQLPQEEQETDESSETYANGTPKLSKMSAEGPTSYEHRKDGTPMKVLWAIALCLAAATASAAPINQIQNGDFSAGAVGFTSDYDYRADGPALDDLWDAGLYGIDDSAAGRHPLWVTQGDHTGDGQMMLVNGRTDGASTVWRQSVSVEAGHSYRWSGFGMNLCCNFESGFDGPTLEFWLDGLFLGLFATDGPGVWLEAAQYFTAGASTAVLEIRNTQTVYRGNDFALDDLSLIDTAQAPEPGAMVLLGTGLLGVGGVARRRRA